MIWLKQKELASWQKKNFGEVNSEKLALGMAEELGELCHYLLKRSQGIREGANDKELKEEIADAFADCMIYGINLMENEGIDAEKAIRMTIIKVLERDWIKYPEKGIRERKNDNKLPR